MAPNTLPTGVLAGSSEGIKDFVVVREIRKAQRVGDVSKGVREQANSVAPETIKPLQEPLAPERSLTPEMQQQTVQAQQTITTMSAEERQALAQRLNNTADTLEQNTREFSDLAIDHALAGTSKLGYATVGSGSEGGRASVNLNPRLLVSAAGEEADEFTYVATHELKHAEDQVIPQGSIIINGNNVIDEWDQLEGTAEMAGLEEVGRSGRPGQPADYAAAQEAMEGVTELVGKNAVDAAMKSGNTEELQGHIWMAQMEGKSADPTMVQHVMVQAEELGYQEMGAQVITAQITGEPLPVSANQA
jgi:hypothetical protein